MRIIVLITAAGKKEAKKIAKVLVEKKLAACVNIIGAIDSVFFWEGKIESCTEALLVVKSVKSKFSRLSKLVKANHSYKVPEIIALPLIAGDKAYLRWYDDYLG